jgi:putative peptidoglycan lipid II flippase
MRTPVRVGLVSVALNLVLNIVFILTWPEGYKHAGLACSTVLSSAFSCVVLAGLLQRHMGSPGWAAILAAFGRALIAAVAMGAIACWIGALPALTAIPGKAGDIVRVAAAVAGGMASYFLLTALICRQELREILAGLKKRG